MKKILFSLIAILITLEGWSQTCNAPTNLSSVQSGNNRIISWTSGGSETQWLLQYSIASDTSFVNSTSVNLVSNQDTIRGLNPSTSYNVRVRAICSATDSSLWSNTYSFTTGCITISSLPWYESFDNYGTTSNRFNPILPNCWSSLYNTNYISASFIYSIYYSYPGGLYFTSEANTHAIAITPQIDNSIPINTLRAKFKLIKMSNNGNLTIGIMNNNTDTSSFTEIAVVSPSQQNTWEDFEIWFNSYTGSGKYIAFKSKDTISNTILLDNLELSLIPSCLNPTNLVANNISTTSAYISWTPGGSETQWTLEYKQSNDTSWNNAIIINNIMTNSYLLSGLSNTIAYDLRVKAICSYNDESEWVYSRYPIHGDNLDLSYNNFLGWNAYQANNISSTNVVNFSNWAQVIGDSNNMSSVVPFFQINSDITKKDYILNTLKRIPTGYSHSVAINYDSILDTTYGKSSRLIYDLDVNYTNYLINLNYAIVFQSNNYSGQQSSFFQIEVLKLIDSNGTYFENGRINPNAFYQADGSSYLYSSGWYSNNSSTYNIVHGKPWTQMFIDASSFIGQKIRIKITTSKGINSYNRAHSYFSAKVDGYEPATCYPPIGINVDSVCPVNAKIIFNTPNAIENRWELLYREIGSPIWNSVWIDTNHYVLNNLLPDANYEALLLTLCTDSTYSDSSEVFNFSTPKLCINSSFNNKTAYLCSEYFYDDGGQTNNHGSNYNYSFTLCPTRRPDETILTKRSSVYFEEFSLGSGDIMKAYSGRSISPQAQLSIENTSNFTGNFLQNKSLISNISDTSGCITFNVITNSTGQGSGFKARIECYDRCQRVIANLDSIYIKYDRLGNMSTHQIRNSVDSIYSSSDSSWTINNYRSIDLCKGDSVVLIAKTQFPDNDAIYHQASNNCIYYWSFGDGQRDTTFYSNTIEHKWEYIKGYDINLTVLDTNFIYLNGLGCTSSNSINTRIRISNNPIKTINPLPDMCSGQTFLLDIGYNANSSIVLDSIELKKNIIGRYDSTIFIPDGPGCGNVCYETSILFEDFQPNEFVNSKDDIKSICINMEHSFLMDLSFEIICPTGQNTKLKNRVLVPGTGTDLGIPGTGGFGCDPANIPQGIGWTYCFSNQYLNNSRGVLIGGVLPRIDSTNTTDTSGYFQTPIQNPINNSQLETVDLNGFSNLIGCPLNGEWKLQICDQMSGDNGYIFWWNIDLEHNPTWEYQVPIDTVIWNGPFTHDQTPSTTLVSPPVTDGGNYRYGVKVIDDFGCIWDTATYLNVVQTPIVNLGGDTSNCEQFSVMLDAGNVGDSKYLWLPTGDTTQTILAQSLSSPDTSITYIAQVIRYNGSIYCYGNDSIKLFVNPTPNAPTNLMVQTRPTYLEITWLGNGTSYEVYRNDTLIDISNQPIYFDSNVIDGTNYCYKIKALNGYCESELSNVICRTYTGLENIINNDLSLILYPNPTKDKTTLRVEGLNENADIIVYDIYGRKIKTYKLNANQNELEIDVKEFAKGVYNIKLTNSNYNITKKLIVK